MSWGAVIVGVGAIAGGILSNKGSKESSETVSKASDKATAAELEMYYQSRKDLAPWREAGATAVKSYQNLLKAGPGKFVPTQQPGYTYGYNQLAKTYLGAQSARGKRFSGETATGLANQAQDYASTQYDNWLNRYYQKLNAYGTLAGIGQTSAGQTASNALSTGKSISNNYLTTGNYIAGNQQDQAAINAGLINNGLNNYLNYTIQRKTGVE